MIPELPHPLWKALHIFPPGLLSTLFRALLLLFLVGLIFWWWRRRRHNALLPPIPVAPHLRTSGSFKGRVEKILSRAIEEKMYRRGFHELAKLAREALSERTGLSFGRMTVAEMGAVLSGKKLMESMRMIEDHQFSREKPRASDLEEAAQALIAGLSRGGRIGLKKGARRR